VYALIAVTTPLTPCGAKHIETLIHIAPCQLRLAISSVQIGCGNQETTEAEFCFKFECF
jgi:hypothetical protein